MNPNAAQTLDPKLKEVYDRVMGTPTSAAGANPPQPAKPIEPTPLSHVPIEQVVVPQTPEVEPTPTPSPTPIPAEPEMVNINTSIPQTQQTKSPRKLSPIIFVAVGIGFFLFYTFVWLKVFGVI